MGSQRYLFAINLKRSYLRQKNKICERGFLKIIYSNLWKLKSKITFIIVNIAYSLYYIYFQFKRKIYKNTYFQAILYGKNTFHNPLSTAGLDIFPRNWNIYITMYKIVLKENLEFNAKKSYLKKLKNNLKLYL